MLTALLAFTGVLAAMDDPPAAAETADLKNGDVTLASTNFGRPLDDVTNSLTAGATGPVLLQDWLFVNRLQSFVRERIPERIVHARGAVAKGTFTLTKDMSAYTSAKLFTGNYGKTTPMAMRMSTVAGHRGSPEFLRDPRGFAIKFYTEEGNYDLVGLNFPIFSIRDGINFPDVVHASKPNPKTGLFEAYRSIDYMSNVPESLNLLIWLMDDTGIPKSFRTMDGHGVHTFKWINNKGESFLVRYTWKTLQGVQSFATDAEAAQQHYSFATKDLVDNINARNFPRWDLYVQIVTPNAYGTVTNLGFDPLDATKDWPTSQIPETKIGTLELNQNVDSEFLEAEQIAFSPHRLVPGIAASDDKLLQARIFAYADAQRYRLGTNNQMIPINRPKCPFHDPSAGGKMNVMDPKLQSATNYFPSAFSPIHLATGQHHDPEYIQGLHKVRQDNNASPSFANVDEYKQPGDRYRSIPSDRKARVASRIATALSDPGLDSKPQVRTTFIQMCYKVDPNLGQAVQANMHKFLTINNYKSVNPDFEEVELGSEEKVKLQQDYNDFHRAYGSHAPTRRAPTARLNVASAPSAPEESLAAPVEAAE